MKKGVRIPVLCTLAAAAALVVFCGRITGAHAAPKIKIGVFFNGTSTKAVYSGKERSVDNGGYVSNDSGVSLAANNHKIVCTLKGTTPGTYEPQVRIVSKITGRDHTDEYDITLHNKSSLVISKSAAKVTVRVDSRTINYGADIPARFNTSISGLLAGDDDSRITVETRIENCSGDAGVYGVSVEAASECYSSITVVQGTTLTILPAVTYSLTGEVPPGVKTPQRTNVKFETPVAVHASPGDVDGYSFSGWMTSDVALIDGKFTVSAASPVNVIRFTGGYEAKTYTLTYVIDGHADETYRYKTNQAVTAWSPPRLEGRTFSGWQQPVPSKMPAKDVKISGSYRKNSYVLTFLVDGEEFARKTVLYDDPVSLDGLDPQAETGWAFSGWLDAPRRMPAKDTAVHGEMYRTVYYIRYIVDSKPFAVQGYAVGARVVVPVPPSDSEGFLFMGWDNLPEKMGQEDLTVEARFVKFAPRVKEPGVLSEAFTVMNVFFAVMTLLCFFYSVTAMRSVRSLAALVTAAVCALPSVFAAGFMLLTLDVGAPVRMSDHWTPVMATVALIQIFFSYMLYNTGMHYMRMSRYSSVGAWSASGDGALQITGNAGVKKQLNP